MKLRAWLASWPTSTGESGGGRFEEEGRVKADLLGTLRAGPGEAARQEVAVGENGPVPSRGTLRTSRAAVTWLTGSTSRGVWRVLQTYSLRRHASCARLFSPDPDYRRKVRRLHRWVRDAARPPDTVVARFLDEFGSQRGPEVAPTGGLEAAVAQRAGTTQQWRTIGALHALTGQVHYLDGSIVGRQQGIQCSAQLDRAYPEVDLIYVIQGNRNMPTPPDVLTTLDRSPRITPVGLPAYAPWLNPSEKLWRWLRQDVLKRHRWVENWPWVKHRVHDFLDQFAHGSSELLRYVGLAGKGKLATVITTS
jgi:hypothetical protein